MILSKIFKDTAFSILDKSKFRGFHFLNDLRFYASHFNLSAETIFDVGANIGQTSTDLTRYFTDAAIHAFEPVNSTFEILDKNLGNNKRIILNNFALGSENKELEILLYNESLINSLLNEVDPQNQQISVENNRQTQVVKIVKGDEYSKLNNLGSIFLLKTDTEGYDLDVLRGFEAMIINKKIYFIFAEVTFDEADISHTSFFKINEYLNLHGYKFSGIYDSIHHGGFLPNLHYCNCLWSSVAIQK
jgi:FkbM family methyltransferase